MPEFTDDNDQRQAGIGYLSTAPLSEPIPEREEKISHLRFQTHDAYSNSFDLLAKFDWITFRCTTTAVDKKTLDFTTRCLFRLADEKGRYRTGEPLLFGSIVRLIHVPSDCTGEYMR